MKNVFLTLNFLGAILGTLALVLNASGAFFEAFASFVANFVLACVPVWFINNIIKTKNLDLLIIYAIFLVLGLVLTPPLANTTHIKHAEEIRKHVDEQRRHSPRDPNPRGKLGRVNSQTDERAKDHDRND